MRTLNLFLADLILVVHAGLVLFNVGALPVIWIGYFRGWEFVRNVAFRITHLLLIAFVFGETVVGAICPLTLWENSWLAKAGQGQRYQRGYIAYWVHRLMFYDLSERVFLTAYLLFFLAVLVTFIWLRPRNPWRKVAKPAAD